MTEITPVQTVLCKKCQKVRSQLNSRLICTNCENECKHGRIISADGIFFTGLFCTECGTPMKPIHVTPEFYNSTPSNQEGMILSSLPDGFYHTLFVTVKEFDKLNKK